MFWCRSEMIKGESGVNNMYGKYLSDPCSCLDIVILAVIHTNNEVF